MTDTPTMSADKLRSDAAIDREYRDSAWDMHYRSDTRVTLFDRHRTYTEDEARVPSISRRFAAEPDQQG